jgi:hypothetical protein
MHDMNIICIVGREDREMTRTLRKQRASKKNDWTTETTRQLGMNSDAHEE